ncbi:hypothetical protein B0H17DRAFT_1148101 [Mycena rosella]|uniref:Uncharacterized protein n=1 Tax=Mycena rosella TaxID=1033263 RepID=A0AAD7CGW9_MYCRO|nr:hypothetical protein B0H17DRAFT_1148101 [Mycena rosella]
MEICLALIVLTSKPRAGQQTKRTFNRAQEKSGLGRTGDFRTTTLGCDTFTTELVSAQSLTVWDKVELEKDAAEKINAGNSESSLDQVRYSRTTGTGCLQYSTPQERGWVEIPVKFPESESSRQSPLSRIGRLTVCGCEPIVFGVLLGVLELCTLQAS